MSSRSNWFAIAIYALSLSPAVAKADLVRSMGEVVEAFESKSRTTQEFDIEARVSMRVDGWEVFRLQGGTHSVHAEVEDGTESQLAEADVGDLVRVKGRTSEKRNRLFVDSIEVLEKGTPESLSRQPAFSKNKPQFWKYVQYTGSIVEVLRRASETRLKLKTPKDEVWFSYYSSESMTDAPLLGMQARVEGLLLVDKISREEPRPRIVASSPQQFRVWDAPRESGDAETAPVELSPERGFISYIDDDSFIACGWKIRSSLCLPLAVDMPVAVDLVELDYTNRTALAVQTRVLSGRTHDEVPPTGVAEISADSAMYRVVCVEGEIVKCVIWPTQIALSLSQSGKRFTAYIPRFASQSLANCYQAGQRARVVGAFFREETPDDDFALHISTLDDIQLIRSAFVLQRSQIAWGAVGLLLIATLAAGWHVALQRRVAAKTTELSQLSATMVAAAAAVQNGIAILDEEDNVLHTNENLHQMFGKAKPGDSAKHVFLRRYLPACGRQSGVGEVLRLVQNNVARH